VHQQAVKIGSNMVRLFLLLIFLASLSQMSFSQSATEVDSLLLNLYKVDDSKDLSTKPQAKTLMAYGSKALPILASKFTDTAHTQVKSACQNFYLTKGEVAIIMADRIETMPYAKLTGIQNCLLEFCKDNPNFIEYYLFAVRRNGVNSFQNQYLDWLKSRECRK
jgi:hypothetical protein